MPLIRLFKWQPLLAIFCAGLAASSQATDDLPGEWVARLAYSHWDQSYKGTVNTSLLEGEQVDVQSDLGFDGENDAQFYLILEHPLGVVPHVKIQHTELESIARAFLDEPITYDNITFVPGQNVVSSMDFSHDDLTLYWMPKKGAFRIGVGLGIRIIDGSFAIRSEDTPQRSVERFDEAIPLPYLHARYAHKRSGLSLGIDAYGASYSGDSFLDADIKLALRLGMGFGAELGYRLIELDIEDLDVEDFGGNPEELDVDLSAKGLYFGISYNF